MPQRHSAVSARDENLTLIEELELGPYEHKSPFDDPLFEHLEPHSGIRLSCVGFSS
jgi:minichromosome maintenance protein 10